jgi:outer membrane protein TolC
MNRPSLTHWTGLTLLTAACAVVVGVSFMKPAASQERFGPVVHANGSGQAVIEPDTWPHGRPSQSVHQTGSFIEQRQFAQPEQFDTAGSYGQPAFPTGHTPQTSPLHGNVPRGNAPPNLAAPYRGRFSSVIEAVPSAVAEQRANARIQTSSGQWEQQRQQPTPQQLQSQQQSAPQRTAAAQASSGIRQQTAAEQVHRGAVYAVAEVAPRGKASANAWQGPIARPVGRIQQVSFEACENCVDQVAVAPGDLLVPYADRATEYPDQVDLPQFSGQVVELPLNYVPWWDTVVNQPTRTYLPSMAVDAESLVLSAINYSPQVTAIRIDPVIRETTILEEEAVFDWTAFLESKYDDTDEPVGNTLTVGPGQTRFKDNIWSGKAGLRKRTGYGGEFDVSQKVGYQDNNSVFFVPSPQGTSRLEVNFKQPLLKGAGEVVNHSRVVLAMLDKDIATEEVIDKLQEHLVSVYEAYWSLYRARSILLQKQRLLTRADEILKMLEARQGIDSLKRQVLRAQAAVASRRSEIVKVNMAIRNTEARLRLLVNSPELKERAQTELLPAELPMAGRLDVSLRGSIETGLRERPDIARAIHRMKAESLRLGVSKNDLLPKLDLVVGAYTANLHRDGQIGIALGDQYSNTDPGFSVGLTLEYPLGNRAANARFERRQWELAKALKEFEAAVETGMTEVELAVRQQETAYQEMTARFQAMIAAETEASYLLERWRHVPGNDQTISFLLEDLLDAQERVASEEASFVNAQVDYVLAVVNLKKAAGILLNCDSQAGPGSLGSHLGNEHHFGSEQGTPVPAEPIPDYERRLQLPEPDSTFIESAPAPPGAGR